MVYQHLMTHFSLLLVCVLWGRRVLRPRLLLQREVRPWREARLWKNSFPFWTSRMKQDNEKLLYWYHRRVEDKLWLEFSIMLTTSSDSKRNNFLAIEWAIASERCPELSLWSRHFKTLQRCVIRKAQIFIYYPLRQVKGCRGTGGRRRWC